MITTGDNEQHVFHHTVETPPKINLKVEKNTKGYNYEITIVGAKSVIEGLALMKDALAQLRTELGK